MSFAHDHPRRLRRHRFALLADPARAAMLHALLSGESLTAGELARVAGIGAPAASAHLARLVEGGLVAVHRRAATATTGWPRRRWRRRSRCWAG